jgi:ApaG protein
MNEEMSKKVQVEADVTYQEEDSSPEDEVYVFSYEITIRNLNPFSVQLLSRHWIITDANGKTEEVRGPGVVGEQPVIAPGEDYTYTSFCPLKTPVGSMQGSYQMTTKEGQNFDAIITPFTLAIPGTLH